VLSRLGGGRFYLIEDANRLHAVFTQETILAARSSVVEKEFRVSRSAPSSVVNGVALDEAPALLGYVVTIPKGRATTLLTGLDGDPVLAVWSAGVGRAAAFTSDLKDRWGVRWTEWSGAARLVAQLGRDITRKGEDGRVRVEADASGGELHVRATVVGDDGRAQSFRRLIVRVAGPDGFSRETALEATGAGAYAASIGLSRPGTYIAIAKDEQSGDVVGTAGAALTAGEELRPTGSDRALLGRIADMTGGRRRDTLAGIFGDRASRRFAYQDITSLLIVCAGFSLLFAVAARRFAIPEPILAFVRRTQASLKPRHVESDVADTRSPDAVVGALLQAKERAARDRAVEARPITPSSAASTTGTPGRVPAPAPRVPGVPSQTSRTASSATPPAHQTTPTVPAPRPLTAAEILLARRKNSPRS
jgi:Ca-activated chloride channel family protein